MELIIFPGKDMPIKRYTSYFKKYKLRKIKEGDTPSVVLCHSRGIIDALEHFQKTALRPRIVCMDGTDLTEAKVNTEGFYICNIRQKSRRYEKDHKFYGENHYYDISDDIKHHPYMDKATRDIILKKLDTKLVDLLDTSPQTIISYMSVGKTCRIVTQVYKQADGDEDGEELIIEGNLKKIHSANDNTIELEFESGSSEDGLTYRQIYYTDNCWSMSYDDVDGLELDEFTVVG